MDNPESWKLFLKHFAVCGFVVWFALVLILIYYDASMEELDQENRKIALPVHRPRFELPIYHERLKQSFAIRLAAVVGLIYAGGHADETSLWQFGLFASIPTWFLLSPSRKWWRQFRS